MISIQPLIDCLISNNALVNEGQIEQFQSCLDQLIKTNKRGVLLDELLKLFRVFNGTCYEEPHYPMASLENEILSFQYLLHLDKVTFVKFLVTGLVISSNNAPKWTNDFIGGIVNNSLASNYTTELIHGLHIHRSKVLSVLFLSSINDLVDMSEPENKEDQKEKMILIKMRNELLSNLDTSNC